MHDFFENQIIDSVPVLQDDERLEFDDYDDMNNSKDDAFRYY